MVVVVDLAGQSHFFVRADMGLGIGKTMGLAIDRSIAMRTDIPTDFSGLFLW